MATSSGSTSGQWPRPPRRTRPAWSPTASASRPEKALSANCLTRWQRTSAPSPSEAKPPSRSCSVAQLSSGLKALERAERALESVEDEVLGALTPDERETLHRLLLRAVESEARASATA